MIFSIFVVLNMLIWFYIICVQVTLASNVKSSNVECSTKYKTSKPIANFWFECSVVLNINESFKEAQMGCSNYNNRSLVVRSFTLFEDDMSFICSSNNAITVDVQFADGIVLKKSLNMTWSRKVVDFNDEATYTYNLEVFPHHPPPHTRGAAVRYTFSSVQFPSETIAHCVGFTDAFYAAQSNFVYWMGDKREIKLTFMSKGNALHIPCVSPFPIAMKHISTNTTVFNYSSTPFGLFLSPIENISNLLGKFECFNPAYNSSSLIFDIVPPTLNYSTNYKIYSSDKNDLHAKLAFFNQQDYYNKNVILEYVGLNFELKCQAKNPYISYIPYKSLNSTGLKCNSTYYTTFDYISNQTFITAVCITSSAEGNYEEGIYTCMDENKNVLNKWVIKQGGASNNIRYDDNQHEIMCFLHGYYENDINFQQDSCYNPLTCKIIQKRLNSNFGSHTSTYCYLNGYAPPAKCATMKIAHKAIYTCSKFRENTENGLSFFYSNIHYLAFDEVVYHSIKSKPPKKAIIKIKNLGPVEQIKIKINRPVKFSFYCEAHSFFFEAGIQWLFQYSNGTISLVPKGFISEYVYNSPKNRKHEKDSISQSADFTSTYVSHSPKKYEEYPNPSSSVTILVHDKAIQKIICAAPRLSILELNNYREWEFEGMHILISDGIAPTFGETDSELWFINGENNKEIKCQASGLPRPTIRWAAMAGKDLSKCSIIDQSLYSVLKFPIYYSADEGDYMCIATNELGSVSKTFSVRTESTVSNISLEKLALLLACIIVVLFPLTFIVALRWNNRKLMMQESIEMNSILQLLNGQNLEFEVISNPLEIPYDRKLELDKHSFCIDETKILGSGEYGIVYKGTIAKLSIDVAFKSLKSQGNMTHLKSLVSELKLLLYIDKHNNIVELLGAYTEEVKIGIIYVAIEYCALGSLQSHLRSNKGKFQNCPVLTSYLLDSKLPREENYAMSESSNYSIKSLLKWCYEISQAMNYLYNKRVVHGDLATRNILLTADWTAKLTDFGLSRRMYNTYEYVKTGQDPLPWRWLALESLLTQVYNVKTDVWAFGITLWEIFSLGATPYPGLSANMEFVTELEKGLRNSKPKYASNELYDVMIACWNCDADKRPSFASLGLLFQNSHRHPTFQVNVEEMEVYGPNAGENIIYLELEEL